MKKHLLLLVFVLVAFAAQAQQHDRDLYSFLYNDKSGYAYSVYSSMQQRDGNHIVDTYLFEDLGNYEYVPLGYMIFKVSASTCTITDSLFVADTLPNPTFLSRDPSGEGNIRVSIEYHEDCDSTFVRISHFNDDDLHTNPEEDVVVAICEVGVGVGSYGTLLDSGGDLIVTYYKPVSDEICDQYIARIGLDGTLKHQAFLMEYQMTDAGPLRVFSESPLRYYQWRYLSDLYDYNLPIDVIDSTFNKNTVTLNRILNRELVVAHPYDTTLNVYEYEYLTINWKTEVIPAGGNDVLVAAQYTHDTNFYALTQDKGVAVAKYDLSTSKLKGYAVFNDFHWYGSNGSPMGLKMMGDGTVYFIYKEHGHPEESVNIVKMDANLNVEWKRFCKTGRINIAPPFNYSIVFDDEFGEEKGIAWCGGGWKDGNHDKAGWVYFILDHNSPVNVLSEFGMEVRPYDYYPNPTQSELHLRYSPDVTPKQIELYDLQGRLVRSQRNDLESFDMEGLASGTYTLRVTMVGGQTFSDKVVKE